MFHHVKLLESMYEFFGFELPFEGETFYIFTILQFRNAYAVYCVTKLLNPICSYLQSLSILFSVYIDDIQIKSSLNMKGNPMWKPQTAFRAPHTTVQIAA